MLIRWSLFVFKHAKAVLLAGLVLIIIGGMYGATVFAHVETNGRDFQNPQSDSARLAEAVTKDFPNSQGQFLVLFSSRSVTVKSQAFTQDVERFSKAASQLPHVTTVDGYYSTHAMNYVSTDSQSTYIQISAVPEYQDEVYGRLLSMTAREQGKVTAKLGGNVAIYKQVNEQVKQDLKKAELISFPVLAVLLLLFFGSVVSAAVPLCLGGMSILGALFIMRLLAEATSISSYAINVVTLLGLGLSIDYSLFMVGRFREELAKSTDVEVALAVTVNRSGRTILLSGTMVAISLLSLLVFPQSFLRSIGLGGAAVITSTVVLSLTLLPAALCLLGQNVNAVPVFRRKRVTGTIPVIGFWFRFSQFVMRWAVLAFVGTFLLLLCVALQFRHAKLSSTDIYTVPVSLSSRQVSDSLSKDFSGYGTEPISILLHEPVSPLSPAGLAYLGQYTAALRQTSGVSHVDSLVAQASPRLLVTRPNIPAVKQLRERYVSGNDTMITVFQTNLPQSDGARALIGQLRTYMPPPGYTVVIGGVSAQLVDLLDSLRGQLPYALAIICLATFVLVFLLTGSVVLPVKAIVLDLLSLCTALGIIVLAFQRTQALPYLPLNVIDTVDATSMVLIFAIAFGLSADYEFFLLSRVKEEYDATMDSPRSIAYGVQKTAGIITAAAILFVSVIGLFLTGKNSLLQQISLGLSAAVIIDATIVRLILVPATMRILGKFNWWAPSQLRKLHQKIGFQDP